MAKEQIVHKDKFGRDIGKDTIVVASIGTREIDVCTVVKQTPKMVTLKRVGSTSNRYGTFLRYPEELIVINDIPETAVYLFTT